MYDLKFQIYDLKFQIYDLKFQILFLIVTKLSLTLVILFNIIF